jgi:hypothetical protein
VRYAGTAPLLLIFVFFLFSRILYCKVVETLAAQEAPLIIFELAAVNICVLPIPCASLQRSFMAMSGNCRRPIAGPGPCAAARARAYRTEDVEHFLGIMRYEWEAFLKQKQLKLELEAMRSIQKTKRQKSWWRAHTREVSSGADEAPVLFCRLACVLVLNVVTCNECHATLGWGKVATTS